MLYFHTGDLLESDCNVIAHQANCFNVMGSGIAKQIKKKYPMAFKMDKQFPYSAAERLGKASYAYYEDLPLIVFNLYGQYFYGRGKHTDYKALYNSIEYMLETLVNAPVLVRHNLSPLKIGLPYYIGSGLGGGRTDKVHELLSIASDKYNIDFHLYKLEGES